MVRSYISIHFKSPPDPYKPRFRLRFLRFVIIKRDNYFTNDSITLNLNSRLTKRLAATISVTGSHIKTEVDASDDEEGETRMFTFPISINLSYLVNRWIRMSVGYTFFQRFGNTKEDKARSHIWSADLGLRF